ncbi:MAG: hypothetical protein RIA65_06485, partial [Woeseia sp.]
MNTDGLKRLSIGKVLTLLISCLPTAGSVAAAEAPEEPTADARTHMPEALRASIKKVVLVAGESPADESIGGTYDKATLGMAGGMSKGSQLGRISKEIGGVPINIPIPILTIPGAIFGGLSGAVKREIQEFRDDLTEELANAENQPLTDDGLALDVFWRLRQLPDLESKLFAPAVEIPEDTDAVLYVSFHEVGIDVQGKEAIISTAAEVTLRRFSNGEKLYETQIRYQDRDTLRNWTANNNALWQNYANYARYYLGREAAAEVFNRVELSHELQPVATDSAVPHRKNKREFVSKTATPTLAWEMSLTGGDPYGSWVDEINEDNTYYDIAIFDAQRLVYEEEQLPDPQHAVGYGLEPCKTYRWSVRPSYRIDGQVRFGEWMRFASEVLPDPKRS